jgi:signal transduction histidine kinase
MANLALWSFLIFGTLSETMVREKLIHGIQEAQSVAQEQWLRSPYSFFHRLEMLRKLALSLRKYRHIDSVIWMNDQGNIVHREKIHPNPQTIQQPNPQPVFLTLSPLSSRIGLELNQQMIEEQVLTLKKELNRQLLLATGISLIILLIGGLILIKSFRRNQEYKKHLQRADRMAYVGTLASGLAHEIRNPLNAMNMNIQLIQEDLEELIPDHGQELLDMFHATRREIKRLENLVTHFLAYARPPALQQKKQSLNPVIKETLQLLQADCNRAGIQILWEPDTGLPDLFFDEQQVHQALLNIIRNAYQVTPSGGTISISCNVVQGKHVLLNVTDTGPGLPKENLAQLTNVFFSTKRGGTGLGLPIAQRIAEDHGGGLKIDSELGRGTTVTIILPLQERKE